MKNETPRQLVRTPEIRSLFAGDPFIEPAREINDLIARRAYELFESSGLMTSTTPGLFCDSSFSPSCS